MYTNVVSILHGKGGVGKSTLAANIARTLQLDGWAVGIIDCDKQGTLGNWAASRSDDALPPMRQAYSIDVFDEAMEELQAMGTAVVVVDGSARLEATHGAVVRISDVVLMPVQPSPADVWASVGIVEVLQKAQQKHAGKPYGAFVVSRRKPGTRLSSGVERVLQRYGLPVWEGTADRVAYAEAMGQGLGVVEMDDPKAAAEVRAITDNLTPLLQ